MSRPVARICCRVAKRRKVGVFSKTYSHEHCVDGLRTFSTTSYRQDTASSVSPAEVSHFSNLASSWWDPHGPSRLLHLMNPLRHEFIRDCLASSRHRPDPGGKYSYLDVGCGGGIFASSAARLQDTESVTAIDPTSEVIEIARKKSRQDPLLSESRRLRYINCALEELDKYLPMPSVQIPTDISDPTTLDIRTARATAQYDIVTLFEVIEHLEYPGPFLQTCLSHLKPGGWLILSTIARHPISYLTTKIVAEAPWPVGIVPSGTHTWQQYINPDELKAWVDKQNNAHNRENIHKRPDELTNTDVMSKLGEVRVRGCVYVPIWGWKWIEGSERFGNYFLGVQKLAQ